MNDDALKVLLDRLDDIQSTVDRIDEDLSHDRQDLQQMAIRLGKLEAEQTVLRTVINSLPKQTQSQVEEAVSGVVEETKNLKEEVRKKELVIMKSKGLFARIFKS